MTRRLLCMLACLASLAGCTLNSNRPLPFGDPPARGRAVLVYGIGLEVKWDWSAFPLDLASYDIDRQEIGGNCFFFNRTEARIPAAPAGLHFVAFDVVPGYYTLSPFMSVESTARAIAIPVPAGQTVYAGTFLYQTGNRVTLVHDLAAQRAAVNAALPRLAANVTEGAPVNVARSRPFMCTP